MEAYRAPTTSPASSGPVLHKTSECLHLKHVDGGTAADPEDYPSFKWCHFCGPTRSVCPDCGREFDQARLYGTHRSQGACEATGDAPSIAAWLSDPDTGPEDLGLSPLLADADSAADSDTAHDQEPDAGAGQRGDA